MLCCGPDEGLEARLGLGVSLCVIAGKEGLFLFSDAVFELVCT